MERGAWSATKQLTHRSESTLESSATHCNQQQQTSHLTQLSPQPRTTVDWMQADGRRSRCANFVVQRHDMPYEIPRGTMAQVPTGCDSTHAPASSNAHHRRRSPDDARPFGALSEVANGRTAAVDVLLAHSYCLRYDAKQQEKMRPYPPMALLYAASLLRSAGYSVAVFDSTFADPRREFPAAVAAHRPQFVALFEDSFNFVIKMCLARMRETALFIAEAASEAGAIVIAAGPDVTDHPMVYLRGGVQYALTGEAELTLRELLDVLSGRSDRSPREVGGLCLRDSSAPDGIARTRRRVPERLPDRFPFPAWDLIDVEAYRHAWKRAHGYFSINAVTTRGCPYQCNWCAKPIWGQQYATRSPANVAEEMALVKHTVRPDHVWFADDIFGLKPAWVEEFADEIEARDAAIPFMIQTRVDRMTDCAVHALKRAGCVEVWMGAESGSQPVLDSMDKGTNVEDIPIACARLKGAGILVGLFLQFGYPGEMLEDIMATVRMVRKCLPDQIGVSVSYPLPGTRFFERVQASIGAKSHWADSGDLAMVFSGPYASPFYRKLHAVVHQDLDVHRRIATGCVEGVSAAMDSLNDAWFELGQLEVQNRNVHATQLAVICDAFGVTTSSRDRVS